MIKCENNGIVTANGTLGELLEDYSHITCALYATFSKKYGKEMASECMAAAFEVGKEHNNHEDTAIRPDPMQDEQIQQLINQLAEAIANHTMI